MNKLLEVKQLSVCFGLPEPVVKKVSFDVFQGETLALVGESGSGKSVSALSILSLLGENAEVTGDILLNQQSVLNQPVKLLQALRGDQIAMIFQEPLTSLNPLHSVEKQISEVLCVHRGMHKQQARERVLELLDLVGIVEPEKRLSSFPHQLSGGQRQRVMIAMALATEPKLLVADEPTTALDVTIQQQILELLQELQQKLGMAILLITHDLNVVRGYADRVAVMKCGELVEVNNCKALFAEPQHPYTKMLLDSEPVREFLPEAKQEMLLDVNKLKVWFPIKRGFLQRTVDHIKAVNGIDFHLKRGETLGIVGESGSGKSTLAQAVLRLTDSEGSIAFKREFIQDHSVKQMRPLRRFMQIVFQDPFSSLSPRMSVLQIIGEGLNLHFDLDEQALKQRVSEALIDVGLEPDTMHRYPHEFSGGQRQRISLARALVLKPEVLILDEPTSALDCTVQKQLLELLRKLQQKYNLSYLFISHDLAVIRALSHRVMVMQHGQLVEQGETEQLFSQPKQEYTRRLINAALI
ncbi:MULTISPECIES: ABC transporter ATP-binding protein [unclassified Agarivorans]|uniref:ABC transporter ATP-binding protein n=1 Tax=unclassified Agarivorans TaxID=2636026 RepID=UPI0026E14786|nr:MULTISPECIES: ABC transporter ATP-binding protein [unclassified Agarivorans]MDO6687666.1 ABC transporter ATP-binding protein [Agarivorans sp. 3_MG-2023]MDO6717220.1 ABC transporter ATP-binding protein [Agarivorans sp. 2_MG-2023]MDO6765790.1 ABC transporter ATP-binding protein [Agarivorans sp. 1_MG-2023]